MIYYKNADFNLIPDLKKSKGRFYDNNIYTFDIETTSILYNPVTGQYMLYDTTQPPEYYDKWEKYGYMYIWQFSINDYVVYGRTWDEFIEFLTVLKKVFFGRKIIYIHNAAFEFQHFKHLFNDLQIFARTNHKIITARSDEYNLEFRCSLFLTNMKLDSLQKNHNLPIGKKSGDLDYNQIRHSKTKLTPLELQYCEYDCLVVYELIKKKREQYKTVEKIPLTQTGELRRECQKLYRDDFNFKSWLQKQLVTDVLMLQWLLDAFMGGYVHANAAYANRIIFDVDSYDIASSYPAAQTSELYPVSAPFEMSPDFDIDQMLSDDKRLFVTEITFYNIRSKWQSNILSSSKCRDVYKMRSDNGRVRACDRLTVTLTSVDLASIKNFYTWDRYEIKRTVGFFAGYLDKKFINYIWDLYQGKTALKGLPEYDELYKQMKQYINACYGMSVTNLITDDVNYNQVTKQFDEPIHLTRETAQQKLDKINSNRNTFLNQVWGIFITAYARKNLFDCMYEIEKRAKETNYACGIVYCDTDSIKCFGDVADIFERYNARIDEKLKRTADKLGLDYEKTRPKTKNGIQKPLGRYEYEGRYTRFKTLGAKKYLTEENGEFHLTLSGVAKSGVSAIKDMDDFKKGFVFDYDHSGKKLLYYGENQPDIDVIDLNGVPGTLTGKSGICLTPCQYKLGITPEYFAYLEETQNDFRTLHGIENI
jgi:hypothetical protein